MTPAERDDWRTDLWWMLLGAVLTVVLTIAATEVWP